MARLLNIISGITRHVAAIIGTADGVPVDDDNPLPVKMTATPTIDIGAVGVIDDADGARVKAGNTAAAATWSAAPAVRASRCWLSGRGRAETNCRSFRIAETPPCEPRCAARE